jgi:hypothetical protein
VLNTLAPFSFLFLLMCLFLSIFVSSFIHLFLLVLKDDEKLDFMSSQR